MAFEKLDKKSGFTSSLEWSMARMPKKGEERCGDIHLLKKYREKVLIGAIDGLGHGKSAAQASQRAKFLLQGFNDESIINLVDNCHEKLRSTRGVVMSLAIVDCWEHTLTWIGVGNVKGILLPGESSNGKKPESMLLKNGIVGYRKPALQASILPITVGDTLIFSTDGVRNGFTNEIVPNRSLDEIVEYIASDYFKKSDDSLILAAKFTGQEIDEDVE